MWTNVSVKKARIQRAPSVSGAAPLGSECEQHDHQQLLEKGCPHAAQVPIVSRRDDACRAQFLKAMGLGLACQDFIHGEEHLIHLQFRSQMPEILHWRFHLGTPCR
jgi:hypothetical protein